MAVPAPPFVRCSGIKIAQAKALNGLYEQRGVWGNHACYRQAGISSGNVLWFVEDIDGGPGWVITPGSEQVGEVRSLIAFVSTRSEWPWELGAHEVWSVCGRDGNLVPCPSMSFSLHLPIPELLVHGHIEPEGATLHKFRKAAPVNNRPCYRRIPSSPTDNSDVRLFFMPRMGRWLLAMLRPETDEEGGVECVFARSEVDTGCTWSALLPWTVEPGGWERATLPTVGFVEVDCEFVPDPNLKVTLSCPPVYVDINEDVPLKFKGAYEPKGMLHGRVFYLMQAEDATCLGGAGPTALWFAEDRGQWVISRPERMSDSGEVLARVVSKAWWPWEAHLGGSTSPSAMGAVPLEVAPPWERGASLLSHGRAPWEVEREDTLMASQSMTIKLDVPRLIRFRGLPEMQFRFLGDYEYAGLLASKPFYLQQIKEAQEESEELPSPASLTVASSPGNLQVFGQVIQRFAVWYQEDREQWVITPDYRLLDGSVVDARAKDSAWLPWEITSNWEVPDGQGSFLPCPEALGFDVLDESGSSSSEEEEDEEEEEEEEATSAQVSPPDVEL